MTPYGKRDALQVAARQERDRKRGIGSADVEAERAGAVVFARLVGVALVLWLVDVGHVTGFVEDDGAGARDGGRGLFGEGSGEGHPRESAYCTLWITMMVITS